MRALIACALLLASCAKGGVEIVVDAGNDQVNEVHLFVGVGNAYTESIKTAKRAFPFPSNTAFARDDYNELDVRQVVGGSAVFQFQGGDKLGVVIAIGMGNGVPVTAGVLRSIEVPADYVARYTLTLEPINTTASPLELDMWSPVAGSPNEGKECVAVYNKQTQSADAVVAAGDPDCDGWPTDNAKECQPNLYMSYKRPALQDAACLLQEMTPQNTVAGCVLGGPACADGHGIEPTCNAPTVFCTPLSVCRQCPAGADTLACARDIANSSASGVTHIQCKLYVDANGAFCSNSLLALSQPPMNIGGHYCKTGGEYPLITSINQGWNSIIAYNRPGTQLTVEVKNVQANCNFEIKASGTVASATTQSQFFGGLVAGMLDNGRGVAIPIVFEVNPALYAGCDVPNPYCQATWSWDAAELIDTCVGAPVFPP